MIRKTYEYEQYERNTNSNKNLIIYLLQHETVLRMSAIKFDKTSEVNLSFLKWPFVINVKRQIASTLANYCFS